MASFGDCAGKRLKTCAKEADQGYDQCTETRDEGYNQCTESRDEGYRDCCDWWPCNWACDAWTWISNIVCIVWTWVSNIVCVVWTWFVHMVCIAWTVISIPICMIIGLSATRWLDNLFKTLVSGAGGLVGGLVWGITHPIAAAGVIISFFRGCPDARADAHQPVLIIAHHGYPARLPENTVQSCQYALDQRKADSLEVDLCMTSDGQIVLWHDWDPDDQVSLARQEGLPSNMAFKPHVPLVGDSQRRPVIDLTLEEFRGAYSYQFQGDPLDLIKLKIDLGEIDVSIPTLGEFLRAAEEWRGLRLVCLDIKMPAESVDRATEMIDNIHASLRGQLPFDVVVMVPSELVLTAMKGRMDQQQFDMKFTWDIEFPAGIVLNPVKYSAVNHAITRFHNRAASVGMPVALLFPWRIYRDTIAYDIKRWNAVNADPAHWNAGVKIDYLIAWTINEEDRMRCLVDMGVSGIITDHPETLASIAGR